MKIIRWILPFFLAAALPVQAAVNRALSIQAPAEAVAGSTVSVTVHASTDASDGEQIGVLQAEYSTDEGKTWTQGCSAEKSGAELSREVSFAVSAQGGKAMVRARVAFRGGAAGDVDYKGGTIQWDDSWEKWRWPPAKYVTINVPPPPVVVPPVAAESVRPAVNRVLSLQAPAEAAAGSTVSVTVNASTDAHDGEHICFPHVDYSIDEGKTWTQVYYEEKSGKELSRKVSFAVNAQGGKTIVRARAAFRGGAAGDVDYKGGAMQWGEGKSWDNWRSPPAKYVIIYAPRS